MVDRISPIDNLPADGAPLSAAIFRQYIRNGAEVALARIASDRAEYRQSICDLSLHILGYSLLARAGWPLGRQIILSVAPQMEQFGYREEWIHCLELCVAWARSEGDTAAQAQIFRILGQLNRLIDRYPVARTWLEQCVANAEVGSVLSALA